MYKDADVMIILIMGARRRGLSLEDYDSKLIESQ